MTTGTKEAGKHTPGPWEFFILDKPMDEIGAYVQECIKASPGKDFFFVSGKHDDGGPADICHAGNGPRSEANARLIAAAPELLEACRPFAEFAAYMLKHPRIGLSDELYGWDNEVFFRLSDCMKALEAVRQAERKA